MSNTIRVIIEVVGINGDLAAYKALQRQLGTDENLAAALLKGRGSATITMAFSTDQVELAEKFKKEVAKLHDDTKVSELQSSDLYQNYKESMDRKGATLLQTSFTNARRAGLKTLGTLRTTNSAYLEDCNNIGPHRADFLSWLFDLDIV